MFKLTKITETKELTLTEAITEIFNNPPDNHRRYREKDNPDCYIDVWNSGDNEPEITFMTDGGRFTPNHRFPITVTTRVTDDTEFKSLALITEKTIATFQGRDNVTIRQALKKYGKFNIKAVYALINGELRLVKVMEEI